MTTDQQPFAQGDPSAMQVLAASFDPNLPGNQSNSSLGLYGISGVGKTSLIATAVEYNWEVFHKITLVYSSDLGGFGNKLLSLIRLGLARVWYMRNHIEAFATMEAASLGAWPDVMLDPETGLADPRVKLIYPVQSRLHLICPNGHTAATVDTEQQLTTANVVCPFCQQIVNAGNALRIERQLIKSGLFDQVGGRAYDSMTQLNDWGMEDLQQKSAMGLLPTSSSGGSALGSADALREGGFAFGTSSTAHYGFLQQRTYGWIKNIRAIPGHVTPPIATFMVEESKGDDASGGLRIMGPKIAGNARTSALPGWLGSCLHATREPNEQGIMRHRLWLVNHYDPTDPRQVPYLAKHRGEPFGMPFYLEDDVDPQTGQVIPWSRCSLGQYYRLLDWQYKEILARDLAKYPDAPGLQQALTGGNDVVMSEAAAAASGGSGNVNTSGQVVDTSGMPAAGTNLPQFAGPASPTVAMPAAQGGLRTPRRRGMVAPVVPTAMTTAPMPVADPPAPMQQPQQQPEAPVATTPQAGLFTVPTQPTTILPPGALRAPMVPTATAPPQVPSSTLASAPAPSVPVAPVTDARSISSAGSEVSAAAPGAATADMLAPPGGRPLRQPRRSPRPATS